MWLQTFRRIVTTSPEMRGLDVCGLEMCDPSVGRQQQWDSGGPSFVTLLLVSCPCHQVIE